MPTDPNTLTLENEIRVRYGYLSWAMDVPELANIFRRAAEGDWDPLVLQGELYATEWWKTHSESIRLWEKTAGEDPAQAERLLQQKTLDIRLAASRLGLSLTPERQRSLADSVLRFGWTEAELQGALAAELQFSPDGKPTQMASTLGSFANNLSKLEAAYMVRLPPDQRSDFIRRFVEGSLDEAGLQAFFVEQAKGRMPYLAAQLDAGYTPKDFYAPLVSQTADLLEISPGQVDLMDQRWLPLREVSDPKTGQVRAPTLYEAANWARQQTEYRATRQGNQQGAGISEAVLKMFGEVA